MRRQIIYLHLAVRDKFRYWAEGQTQGGGACKTRHSFLEGAKSCVVIVILIPLREGSNAFLKSWFRPKTSVNLRGHRVVKMLIAVGAASQCY